MPIFMRRYKGKFLAFFPEGCTALGKTPEEAAESVFLKERCAMDRYQLEDGKGFAWYDDPVTQKYLASQKKQ